MATRPLSVTVSRRDDETILITVVGQVDLGTVALLRPALAPAPRAFGDDPRIVVDLSRVEFLSASALEALHRAAHHAPVALVANTHQVMRALEATGVAEDLAVHPSVGQALAARRGPDPANCRHAG